MEARAFSSCLARVYLVVLAAALMLLAHTPHAVAQPPTSKPSARPTVAPAQVKARIKCSANVLRTRNLSRRLNKLQHVQLRYFGAYRLPARRANAHRKAIPSRWACARTKRQLISLRRQTRTLGSATKDRDIGQVEFPRTLDQKLTISLPDGDEAGWRMLDVPKIPVKLYETGAVYSTASWDVVQKVSYGRMKESIVVHQKQGTKTWRWRLHWSGGNAPALFEDGTIRYGARVALDRPFLEAPGGRKIKDLDWQLDGDILSVTVDDENIAAPYVIDPASSYPQRIYPLTSYVSGSSTINDLNGTAPGGGGNWSSDSAAQNPGEILFWSQGVNNTLVAGGINNTTLPDPYDPPGATYDPGTYGWAQEALGGATLAPGPYTAQARLRYSASNNAETPVVVQLKARLWNITLNGSGRIITSETRPITDWSAAGPPVTFNATGDIRIATTTMMPVDRYVAADEHVYLEMGMVIVNDGRNGSVVEFNTSNANTFIDFGAPATNTPGTAGSLRISSPTPLGGSGWTTDDTPTLRANLDDPDWWHHIEYQICTDPSCSAVVASGTSPFGQVTGSANNAWISPALPEGLYYMRARTVEDSGGDDQIGAWTSIASNTCSAPDLGPCDTFGVDRTNPWYVMAPPSGNYIKGSYVYTFEAHDDVSGVASTSMTWTRTSPSPAGPSSSGTSCSAGVPPYVSCTFNTTTVIDGTYDLTFTITDVAGNSTSFVETFIVDNTPPVLAAGGFVNDGLTVGVDIDYISDATRLQGRWDLPVTDANPGAHSYCVSTAPVCAGTIIRNWTGGTFGMFSINPTYMDITGLSLVEGTTYYTCVVRYDMASNVSPPLCSDGQTLDTTPPTAPTVRDGIAADIAYNTVVGSISGNWIGGGDSGSGIDRWEYCVSTSVDCSSGVLINWTSNGTSTTFTNTVAGPVEGLQYFVCVRGFDRAGLQTLTTPCSNGQLIDTVAPPAPTTVNDGSAADIAYQPNTTTIQANWPAVVDPVPGVGVASGLQRYQYCITTNSAGTNCTVGAMVTWTDNVPATANSLTRSGLSLIDGTTYYVCIRDNDVAGNSTGTYTCSNGVTIDGVPPVLGAVSDDGIGPGDIDWTTDATSLSSHWSAATDANGIDRYEFCLSTLTGCAGTIMQNWTSNATTLSQTTGSLSLVQGQIYFSCVRAFDPGGNMSTTLCSDGQSVDSIAPGAPASLNDGTGIDIDYSTSLSTLSGNWPAVVDFAPGSGLARYEYCFSTNAIGSDCVSGAVATWTATTAITITRSGLTLTEGSTYFLHVRAVDVAGNMSPVISSDGQMVDATAPTDPTPVEDGAGADIDITNSGSQMDAHWTASTDSGGSGFARYEWCLTTSASGADCSAAATVAFTSNASATSVTRTGLSLVHNTTYYNCVRALDNAGNSSAIICSDGVTVDTMPPPAPAPVIDGAGADIDAQSSATTTDSHWATVTDPSGINRYELCISTSASGADCATSTTMPFTSVLLATSATRTGLTLTNNVTYFHCVRAFDNGGNASPLACSDGVLVDTAAPTAPATINDGSGADITWNTSGVSIAANWVSATDAETAVAGYQVCVSTSAAGADCAAAATMPWTAHATTSGSWPLSLTGGSTYYVCVRALDSVGNIGAPTCSNGQTVDANAPTAPTPVNDSTGVDIDITNSATTLSANWGASVDAETYVADYQWCLTTNATGSDCATGAVQAWASTTGTLSMTNSSLTLIHNTTYYACVRAIDAAANASTVTCSDGVIVDIAPPPNPSPINDGMGADQTWTASSSTLSANWPAVTDPSGINRYERCLTTDPTGADCATSAMSTWTSTALATSMTQAGLSLTNATTYYTCVRAFDNGGNGSSGSCSNGITVDTLAPSSPGPVNDGAAADITWNQSATSLAANWNSSTDTGSGLATYEWCISTSSAGADCSTTAVRVWTANASLTSASAAALSLAEGATYYACVRAIDAVGNTTTSVCSNGQAVDSVNPTSVGAVNDGVAADIDISSSGTTIQANWSASTDATSGVDRHEWCISTSPTGADCGAGAMQVWTSTGLAVSATNSSLSLTHNTTYYVCVRAFDVAANASLIICSDGVLIDIMPPPAPGPVLDGASGGDMVWNNTGMTVAGRWTAVTDPSGINRYEMCVSTDPGGIDCATTALSGWASEALALNGSRGPLALVDGTTYYVCVRAFDNGGNASPVACSNGQVADQTAPSTPTTVNDGVGADSAYITSTSNHAANWAAATDSVSAVSGYQWCITTNASGSDCATTATRTWTGAPSPTATATGLALAEGTTYYACARAIDNAGNIGAMTCSDGALVDTISPAGIAPVNDGSGADIDYSSSATTLDANWASAVETGSGLATYEWCISTSSTGSSCTTTATLTWTAVGSTSTSAASLSLTHNTTYYVCVRARDNAGNTSVIVCSDGITVDILPPPAPAPVRDGTALDIDFQQSTAQIDANWPAVTDPSGISRYDWCVSTTATGSDCGAGATMPWTSNLTATSATASLMLSDATTYYVCVIAYDGGPNASTVSCSDGVTVDATAPAAPASVNDGATGNLTYVASLSSLAANWTAPVDATSGLASQQMCISTNASGSDCASTATLTYTTVASSPHTRSGLTLVQGTTYYMCIRGIDVVGNIGTATCSDGQTTDTIAPAAPASVNDGTAADIDFQSSTSQLDANWSAATDATSGIARYDWCITTTSSGSNCASSALQTWVSSMLATSATRTGLSLIDNTTYYVCVRAVDNAGNIGATGCSDGNTVDIGPPPAPASATDGPTATDIDWTMSTTTLDGRWSSVADASGIDHYEYCLTTNSSGSDCAGGALVAWTSTASATTVSNSSLTLVDMMTYYLCARAVDGTLNVGPSRCSDGVTVDATAPGSTAPVNDGAAADITFVRSLTTISANWVAPVDFSGIAGYDLCISTSNTGGDCAGGALVTWSPQATASATRSGLTLTQATTYYVCVLARDVAGNIGAASCSNGQTTDTIAPSTPSGINDGTASDIDFQASTTQLDANWTGSTDATSGINRYEWCITTIVSGSNCNAGALQTWTSVATATSTSRTGLSLINATTYYVCVRAYDNAGNNSPGSCSDGNTIDIGPPPAPTSVRDGSGADIDSSISLTSMDANWSSVSDPSGISDYEWCISTSATGADCAGGALQTWVSAGTSTSASASSLTLTGGMTYYNCIRAIDGTLNVGAATCSDGMLVDDGPPTMGAVRDGAAADVDYTASLTTLNGNWDVATDLSGISYYEVCFTASSTGADCVTTALSTWTSTGTTTSASRSSLTLTAGSTYYMCVRATDVPGNTATGTCTDGVTVDITGPTSVNAIFPANGASVPEGMFTYDWSAGTDPAGVTRYDIYVDGTVRASSLAVDQWGVLATYAGAHTWRIRAYDSVGNWSDFNFTFTATPVPDTTPPDPFDLLTPTHNMSIAAGTPLTWQSTWDFKGVTQYRVYIDGILAGTTAGTATTFTPAAGVGSPICSVDFDPSAGAGCLSNLRYSWGQGANTTTSGSATSADFNLASYTGWSASGQAIGVGNPTVSPITQAAAGFDGDRRWTAAEYDAAVPASGAFLRFEHRYNTHVIGQSAYDGATVQLKVDDEGNGFGDDPWETTCEYNAKQIYGATIDCNYQIVDFNGGYNAVMGGADRNAMPLSGQHAFAGDSGGTVQTSMNLGDFAGMNVKVRFIVGTDSCYTGITGPYQTWCTDPQVGAPGYHPVQWRIDNIQLVQDGLAPGNHTWYVEARDAAGNTRQSNQTWTFNLLP